MIFYRLAETAGCWSSTRATPSQDVGARQRAPRAGDVELANLHGERALIAIQGPRSVEMAAAVRRSGDSAAIKYYSCAETRVARRVRAAVIARTGYTGEDGFELLRPGRAAAGVWDAAARREPRARARAVRARRARRAAARGRDAALRSRADRRDHAAPSRAGLGDQVRQAGVSRQGRAARRSATPATTRASPAS